MPTDAERLLEAESATREVLEASKVIMQEAGHYGDARKDLEASRDGIESLTERLSECAQRLQVAISGMSEAGTPEIIEQVRSSRSEVSGALEAAGQISEKGLGQLHASFTELTEEHIAAMARFEEAQSSVSSELRASFRSLEDSVSKSDDRLIQELEKHMESVQRSMGAVRRRFWIVSVLAFLAGAAASAMLVMRFVAI